MSAMFSKEANSEMASRPSSSSSSTETIIGPTVQVEGSFTSDDNVTIEGQVKGSVSTSKNLRVGNGAVITADVQAESMHISGEVQGNLTVTSELTLTSTAKVIGDITASVLSIETGAVVQGQCSITGPGQGAATSTSALSEEE